MGAPVTVKAQLASISSKISTVGQARAAIGHATAVLHEGYVQLSEVTDLAGLADQARSNLDAAQAYAQKVYADLESDDASQARALTLKERLRAAEVVRECAETKADVIDAAKIEAFSWDDFVQGFLTVVEAVGAAAGDVAQTAAKGVIVLLWAFIRSAWLALLLVALALVVVVYVRRRGLAALKGAAA